MKLDYRALRILALAGIAVALFLRLPGVTTPFFADDLVQMTFLENGDPGMYSYRTGLELYRFLDGDREAAIDKMSAGDLPWRFDVQQRVMFFRPFSSALMWLDHALFGTRSTLAHLHSFVWFLVYLLVLYRLYHRLLPCGAAAKIAVVAASLSTVSSLTITWWAGRYGLLVPTFVAASLLFHYRWCKEGRLYLGILSLGSLALALLSGESGMQALAYLFAFTIVEYRRTPALAVTKLLPSAAVFVLYQFTWFVLGHGTEGSALYQSPTNEPAAYLTSLATRLHVAVIASFTAEATSWQFGAFVLAVVGALAWGPVRRLRNGAIGVAGWLLLGLLLSLIPCFGRRSSFFPWAFMGPQIGAHAILGTVIAAGWLSSGGSRAGGMVARLGSVFLLVICVLWPARNNWTSRPVVPSHAALAGQFPDEVRQRIDERSEYLIFLVAPVAVMPKGRLWVFHDVRTFDYDKLSTIVVADTAAMQLADGDLTLTRVDPNTLLVKGVRPLTRKNDVFRFDSRRPYEVGQTITLQGVVVRMEELKDGRPTAVRCTFSRALDSEGYLLLTWSDGAYRDLPPPRIGQTISLH